VLVAEAARHLRPRVDAVLHVMPEVEAQRAVILEDELQLLEQARGHGGVSLDDNKIFVILYCNIITHVYTHT